jgi:hypothetical protein
MLVSQKPVKCDSVAKANLIRAWTAAVQGEATRRFRKSEDSAEMVAGAISPE